MIDKKTCVEKFSALPSADQTGLRIYMAFMTVNNISIFVMSRFKFGVFSWLGILLNAIILYWSIDIKRATSFYYRFIIWSFWYVLIFNGSHALITIFRYPRIEISIVGSLVNLVLVCFFVRAIFRYREALIERHQSVQKSSKLPPLTLAEEKGMKLWVRATAIFLIVWGMVNWIFSEWLRSYEMSPEEPLIISMVLIAALGLMLFRQNLGRRFCLFVQSYGQDG